MSAREFKGKVGILARYGKSRMNPTEYCNFCLKQISEYSLPEEKVTEIQHIIYHFHLAGMLYLLTDPIPDAFIPPEYMLTEPIFTCFSNIEQMHAKQIQILKNANPNFLDELNLRWSKDKKLIEECVQNIFTCNV